MRVSTKVLVTLAAVMGLLTPASVQPAGPESGARSADAPAAPTLAEARAGQAANVAKTYRQPRKPVVPPVEWMSLVAYPGPLGDMAGYLAKPFGSQGRRPAIIWISGGDTAIGDFWSPQPRGNDQSAAAFRDAGMVVFYPAVRGLNGNPGQVESYFGELDDLVAATRWLKAQPFIDPDRVYLGGHSSGGTMALLAAEYASEWAAVFAFGPVIDPQLYGKGLWGVQPVAATDKAGQRLRAPIHWLSSITMPTLVLEGTNGNAADIADFGKVNANPKVRFGLVGGCSHFSILRPGSEMIAGAIRGGTLEALMARDMITLACE